MRRTSLLIAAFTMTLIMRASSAGPRPVVVQDVQTVRIGLNQGAASVTIRSNQPFIVRQNTTRSAKFTMVVAVPPDSERTLRKEDIQYRTMIELDGGKVLIVSAGTKIRISPGASRLEFDGRSYRGLIEVFSNPRNAFTVVNELPMEEYLLGVVPNELSPRTYAQLEALKAQAVAARTYVVRNLGQYARDGFDICNTDACQVYFGAGTEDPLATQAVNETSGVIATYDGKPINALYSSTCGGRTESAENIFEEKLPYLVSVLCEYKHPEPKPFSTSRIISDWKDAVLTVAGVSNFADARHFLGLSSSESAEPPSMSPQPLSKWLRENFYANVRPPSDLEFLTEQGILSFRQTLSTREVLYRLIDRKGAFEWQQGVLVAWDGQTASLLVNNVPVDFKIKPDAPIFQHIGEDRVPMKEGMWIGGELFDFRAVDGTIEMLAYRKNFVNATADRYSRLAMWQVHKTRAELDAAFKSLNIGQLKGLQVIERGPSLRPISTDIIGSAGKVRVRALRFRTLLGLRDSLVFFDEERNVRGELIGMSFYGQGWGHGVGMCQVGAYGMALEGATFDQILKKYYTGIELKKIS